MGNGGSPAPIEPSKIHIVNNPVPMIDLHAGPCPFSDSTRLTGPIGYCGSRLEKIPRHPENDSSCCPKPDDAMPANLTPQYMQAEAEYKQAQTPEERLECLKKMYALMPKHKGTDKLQAELKSKISAAKDEVERTKKGGKKGGISYKVPKQGAGQYVLLGAANSGKSRLLTSLTRAHSEVAAYPFTTREPIAGMMDWQDVRVQLIDLPPITADYLEPYVTSLARAADAALLFVDLADDDGPFATQIVIDRLA